MSSIISRLGGNLLPLMSFICFLLLTRSITVVVSGKQHVKLELKAVQVRKFNNLKNKLPNVQFDVMFHAVKF